MPYDPLKHHRKSIRLDGYDYSSQGCYFITFCTKNRMHLFGEIVNGNMILNDSGMVVQQCWLDIPMHFPYACLGEFAVMPNHVHGIIQLKEKTIVRAEDSILQQSGTVRANNYSPRRLPNGTSQTIGSIVRGFKIGVTKYIHQRLPRLVVWQRNYWEHIIRNQIEYTRIQQYIVNNPKKWRDDKLNGGIGNRVLEPAVMYEEEVWMV